MTLAHYLGLGWQRMVQVANFQQVTEVGEKEIPGSVGFTSAVWLQWHKMTICKESGTVPGLALGKGVKTPCCS